jgi:hypothetical protein
MHRYHLSLDGVSQTLRQPQLSMGDDRPWLGVDHSCAFDRLVAGPGRPDPVSRRLGSGAQKLSMGETAIHSDQQAPPRIWRMDQLGATAKAIQSSPAFAADKTRSAANLAARRPEAKTAVTHVDFCMPKP